MGAETEIAWTDATFNPWWGCVRVSPGCEHCYAETFSKRVGLKVWGPEKTTDCRFFKDKHWNEPVKWNREAEAAGVRKRVFCASMADVFESREDLVAPRARLFRLIEATPHLDWLLLTKRPENMIAMSREGGWSADWPANVWAGTTCEDQQRANERLPELLRVPASVRFVSYEPAIGPVDFTAIVDKLGVGEHHFDALSCDVDPEDDGDFEGRNIDWIIVGGESGGGARPFDIEWARRVVRQCHEAGVACFVKQLGSGHPRLHTDIGRGVHVRDGDARFIITDAKGGDWNEWPADLRVREWPKGKA